MKKSQIQKKSKKRRKNNGLLNISETEEEPSMAVRHNKIQRESQNEPLWFSFFSLFFQPFPVLFFRSWLPSTACQKLLPLDPGMEKFNSLWKCSTQVNCQSKFNMAAGTARSCQDRFPENVVRNSCARVNGSSKERHPRRRQKVQIERALSHGCWSASEPLGMPSLS